MMAKLYKYDPKRDGPGDVAGSSLEQGTSEVSGWWGRQGCIVKVLIVLVVIGVIGAILGIGKDDDAKTTATTRYTVTTATASAKTTAATSTVANRSPEWHLAFIQSNDSSLSDTDPLVAAFARHLDSLEAKTTNARSHIADITVNCWQVVNAEGFDDSLMRVIQELDTSVPDGLRMELSEVAAAWVLLRIN